MSETRNHTVEGRKREERVGELQSMARHKRGLTNWRGGRGRSGLVNFEAWHVTTEDSLAGGEDEGGAGWGALKCGTTQTRTHQLEGCIPPAAFPQFLRLPHLHPPLPTPHPPHT